MKKQLCLLIMCLPLLIMAQSTIQQTGTKEAGGGQDDTVGSGIKWTTGLSWEQIKQKAKQENKYIFLDCYTTWCPPCKKMDEVTFTDNSVGNYINDHFISVKVQMDKTKKDDVLIQSWYDDAVAISKQFHIEVYPTFIFISPQGVIVEKDMGFKGPAKFVNVAKGAIKPGKVYNDPYEDYNRLVADFRNGDKHYDKIIGIIEIAKKKGENEFARKLMDEHTNYVAKLSKDKRYTKEAIILWSKQELKSSDQLFKFFYEDGDLIDEVLGVKGHASEIVDKIIFNEVINPFFKQQTGGAVMVQQGMGLMFLDALGQPIRSKKEPEPDLIEADWKNLSKSIRKKFNKYWAIREVQNARILWYEKHNNWVAYTSTYLQKLKTHGIDGWINNRAFDIFLHVNDKGLLNQLIPWVEQSIVKYTGGAAEIDTYANLLYKVGRQQDAIEWESKAAELAGKDNGYYMMIVEKMKKGEQTWN